MANYTMTIKEMIDNPLIGLFDFNYPFYVDDENAKKQFETLFIEYYYLHEIGFETPERFKQRLKATLILKMPYYEQLYKTEWFNQKSEEQMMTSKNLVESTIHEQLLVGTNSSDLKGNTQNNQENTATSIIQGTSESEQSFNSTTSGTNSQTSKASNLADGVAQSSLGDGYLSSVSQTEANSSESTNQIGNQSTTSNDTTNINGTQSDNSIMNQSSSGKNEQKITDTTIFTSKGDVGIQTPSYAIEQWRGIIININEQLINDCNHLFMSLY